MCCVGEHPLVRRQLGLPGDRYARVARWPSFRDFGQNKSKFIRQDLDPWLDKHGEMVSWDYADVKPVGNIRAPSAIGQDEPTRNPFGAPTPARARIHGTR